MSNALTRPVAADYCRPMTSLAAETLDLYRNALVKTWGSLVRGWLSIMAIVGFAILLFLAVQIASPLGLAGGFLLGAVNALLVGATLGLLEVLIRQARAITFQDILDSFGSYFWDVIGVGFVLWIPLMVLEMGTKANPQGEWLSYAVLLLIFLLLNPAPEVIYQVRHDSPLDVFKTSYDFVMENWIEWFLPLAVLLLPIVLSPMGIRSFFTLSSRVGRGAGLDFFQLLVLPFTIIAGWFDYVGIPSSVSWILLWGLTPPVTVAMLLFRGHLFASLQGSTRRKRRFESSLR